MNQPIRLLFLVGGAGSEYLIQRIKVRLPRPLVGVLNSFQAQFGSKIAIIARPSDAGVATLNGTIYCGLSKKQLVSSIIATRSYMMNVCLLNFMAKSSPMYVDARSSCQQRAKTC